MDERVRLLERSAALGNEEAANRLRHLRIRCSDRSPLLDPIPGDVVRLNTNEVRHVFRPLSNEEEKGLIRAINSSNHIRVCSIRQWRKLARGGEVLCLSDGRTEYTVDEEDEDYFRHIPF